MQAEQINIEYFFRLLYELLRGVHATTLDYTAFQAFLAHVWLGIVIVGYVVSVLGLVLIVYLMMRLFELRRREEEFYRTPLVAPGKASATNPRWEHITKLMEGENPSGWKEAIVEADILLDDVLTRQGYEGNSMSDKLKNAEFSTLEDAWEAHKVRNQIAHQGSTFDLSETLARRTISRYEAVFREFRAI